MAKRLSMDKAFIKKLTKIIKVNLDNENFGVSELATEAGLSRSQLHRKLHDINGKSTSQFIREYRLEKAMEMLKLNVGTASEIAYRVGFSSPTYFNTSFHNFYGYPPGEVKFQRAITPPKKTFAKKVVSIVPVIILIALIVFSKVFKKDNKDSSEIEKTIAVMPFVNDSPNNENMYFCNGIMAGVRDYLAKIPEFSIASRLSVEKYRNSPPSLKVIGKDLGVNYLVEGRVQRIGDKALISAELININTNEIVWSESYNKDVTEVFEVQADVIESISTSLQTVISPTIKEELNAGPTKDKNAYEYYLKGEEYRFKANKSLQKYKMWVDLLEKAKLQYELAIERDSLYSSAYMGLALVTFERYSTYVGENNKFDDVLQFTDKVIKLDPNYASAYIIRGDYFRLIHEDEKAILNYKKSLKIIPNNLPSLNSLIKIYKRNRNYNEVISTLKIVEERARSRGQLMRLYTQYLELYRTLDNNIMVDYYFDKIFELQTKVVFRRDRVYAYIQFKRYDDALDYVNKTLIKDNQQRNALLGSLYRYKGDLKKAILYWEKCYKQVEKEGVNSLASRTVYLGYGMCLVRDGQVEKGKNLIRKQAELYKNLLFSEHSLDKPLSYYALFLIYGALGDIEKSNEYIDKFEKENGWLFWNFVLFIRADLNTESFNGDLEYLKASIKRGEKQLEHVQKQIRPLLPSTPPSRTE